MPTLTLETQITAPIEVCFDLARDVETHLVTAAHTQERIVGGKSRGLLELGDELTFEAVHLGVKQKLSSRVVEFDRPHRFTDQMISGAFRSLRHIHEFSPSGSGTLMRDILEWESPFGFLGGIADRVVIERHLREFLVQRNKELKRIVEARLGI
jgi:ligand-binding SRPBCC domain-containing protein